MWNKQNANLSNEITFFAYQIEEDEKNLMPSGEVLENQDLIYCWLYIHVGRMLLVGSLVPIKIYKPVPF